MKRITFVVSLIVLVFAVAAEAQHVVGTISGPATYWKDMVFYQTGGKLFIADNTNAQILVYDAKTLAYLDTVPLSAFLPDSPQQLAVHEGTGTLYVVVDEGGATHNSTVVIINAKTHAIMDSMAGIGWDAALFIDENRARLYVLVGNIEAPLYEGDTLMAVDVNTNTIVGSLNLYKLLGDNDGRITYEFGNVVNPVTGELVFGNGHYEVFVVVDGPNLTGEMISATGSRGYAGTWNPHENKLYITRAAWNGYFIYDRDTETAKIAQSYNDGTSLFYSQATNRVYSGAEVNWDSTVIEGDTDEWQDIEVGGGLYQVGFVTATRHAYFACCSYVRILDEDTLAVGDSIPGCGWGTLLDTNIVVDQKERRVFIRSYWSASYNDPEENSCVLVIDDEEDDILATWDGQGVYYRNSETAGWGFLASPANLIAAGDIDGDYSDDLIGVWTSGLWVKYSKANAWARLSASVPTSIACGDMNGDCREDIVGSWPSGVWYRNSVTGKWVSMSSSPASLIAAGYIDGDNKEDLIGVWSTGLWLKSSSTGSWTKLGTSLATDIACGDMNGDGRDDVVGSWPSGVWYRNSATGGWVLMSSGAASQVAAGDIDGDSTDDLIGAWTSGVYVKKSSTMEWVKIPCATLPRDIGAGLYRFGKSEDVGGPASTHLVNSEAPGTKGGFEDLSNEGPGGGRFMFEQEENLIPFESNAKILLGPGEPGLQFEVQDNLVPKEDPEKDQEKGDR